MSRQVAHTAGVVKNWKKSATEMSTAATNLSSARATKTSISALIVRPKAPSPLRASLCRPRRTSVSVIHPPQTKASAPHSHGSEEKMLAQSFSNPRA